MTKIAIIVAALLYGLGARNPASRIVNRILPSPQTLPSQSTLPITTLQPLPSLKNADKLASAVYVYDATTRHELLASQADQPLPLASLTKLMTAVVSVLNYKETDVLSAPDLVSTLPAAKINLEPGEQMTVHSLEQALLIPSANDAAETLAAGLGRDRFIQTMNETAAKLGLGSLHFADPAGLSDGSVGSAKDIARLLDIVQRNPRLQPIIETDKTTVSDITGNKKYELTTTDLLLGTTEMRGISGGKTGFTEEAGYNLAVVTTEADGRHIIVVVLHAAGNSKQAAAEAVQTLINEVRSLPARSSG